MIRATNSSQIVGYVTSSQPEAKPYEMGLLTLWLIIILLPAFPGITLFRYSLVFYFLSFLILDSQRAWKAIGKAWIVLPLPIVGVLSMFWSPYPDEAFRTGLLHFTSVLIVSIVASRYSPRQVLRCLVIAATIGTLYAALFISTAHLGGPYASKNFLALHMLLSFIACMATALDKRTPIFLSLPFFVVASLAAFIIVVSAAVTNTLLLMGAALILIVIRFVFLGLAGLDGARTLLIIFGVIFIGVLSLVFVNYLDPKVVDEFLALFGKDSSLTGRTDLWAAARKVIADNPLLGVGLEGFWQYDVGAAQTLNENDHKDFGTKLGFHNAYLDVAVHLGLLGLGFFVCSVIWASSIIMVTFLRNPDMVSGAFFTIAIVSLTSSMTESFLAGSFNIPASMFFVSATMYSIWRKPRVIATLTAKRVPQLQA